MFAFAHLFPQLSAFLSPEHKPLEPPRQDPAAPPPFDWTSPGHTRAADVSYAEPWTDGAPLRGFTGGSGDVEYDTDENTSRVGDTGATVGDKRTRTSSTGTDYHASTASESDSRELDVGGEHIEARVGKEKKASDRHGSEIETGSASAGVADGKVKVSVGKGNKKTKKKKGANGQEVETVASGKASSTSLAVDDHSAAGTHTRGTTKDGRTTSASGTGSVDWEDGKVAGSGTYSTEDENGNKTSVSGGGSVDVSENGLQGVEGNASASANGVKVSVKGGYRVEASEPKQVGERWVVTWRRTAAGGVGAGAENKRAGASVAVNASSYEMGSRSFSTRSEAEAFHDDASSMTHSMGDGPTTLEGAFQLKVGESRGEGSSAGVGGDVKGSAGGVTVGASGHASKEGEVEVRRTSANIFEVTVSDKSTDGLGMSVGGFGMTASKGSSDTDSHATTVRFDLSTSEGRNAFESYTKTRQVPETGGDVIAVEDGKAHDVTDGIDLAGIGNSRITGKTWEKQRWDERGKHEEYGGRRSHDVSYGRIGDFLGGEDTRTSFQLIGRQEDDETTGYIIEGTFSGESGYSNHKGMAQLTGEFSDRSEDEIDDGGSSGTWHLSADMNKEDVDAYCEHIAENRDFDYGEVHDLQVALRKAKNDDDKMRAITKYVAGKGVKGLQNMGARRLSYDVELEGDPNFPGRGGRLELEDKAERYGQLLEQSAANGATVTVGLQSEIEALRARREAVADDTRYTDLPDDLRRIELNKIDAAISSFVDLRNQASLEGVKNHPGQTEVSLEQADEEGTAPADPQQRQLYALRHEISETQSMIAYMDGENRRVEEAIVYSLDHGQRVPRLLDAMHLEKKRRAMDAGLSELRMMFLRSAGDPGVAIAYAGMLVSQLAQQESLASQANDIYLEAARTARGLTTASERRGQEDVWEELALADEEQRENEELLKEMEAEKKVPRASAGRRRR